MSDIPYPDMPQPDIPVPPLPDIPTPVPEVEPDPGEEPDLSPEPSEPPGEDVPTARLAQPHPRPQQRQAECDEALLTVSEPARGGTGSSRGRAGFCSA